MGYHLDPGTSPHILVPLLVLPYPLLRLLKMERSVSNVIFKIPKS